MAPGLRANDALPVFVAVSCSGAGKLSPDGLAESQASRRFKALIWKGAREQLRLRDVVPIWRSETG